MKAISTFSALFAGALIFATACSSNKSAISGVVTFTAGNAFINNSAAKIGEKVSSGDTVSTKADSCMVVQFYGSSLATLHENSSLKVDSLADGKNGKDNINLEQDKGISFNKIIKDKASYQIHSSTTVAAVRGTSFTFATNSNGKDSSIKLLHGVVDLTTETSRGKTNTTIHDGEKINADAGSSAYQKSNLAASESSRLKMLDKIVILPRSVIEEGKISEYKVVPDDVVKMLTAGHGTYQSNAVSSDISASVEKSETPAAPSAKVSNAAVKPAAVSAAAVPVTLEDLARQYGKLSTLFTSTGKEYIGAFRQKGDAIEMITTVGTVKIPTSDVKKVAPYNL